MLNEIYQDTKEQMDKSIQALKHSYKSIRTGKVSTSVLDGIKVDYYGTPSELSQIASVLATDASTICISPWEKNLVPDIEKAIYEANIGVNPNNDGESVKLFFSPMTIDQRKENAKKAKNLTDDAKISLRNIRKQANDRLKKLHKDKEVTDDENKKALDEIQKITDSYVVKSDEVLTIKEKEILTV